MLSPDEVDASAGIRWAEEALGPIAAVRPLAGGCTSTMLALDPVAGERAVLRMMTEEPWRTHGAALTTRESEIQRMLAAGNIPIPAPRSVALDASGQRCGHPAHLMTLLPGSVDGDRVDETSLGMLADLLAAIHAVEPTSDVRRYQSWAWEAKYVVPDWAADGRLWERAFDLLRAEPPAYEACFIHRDFYLRNVLWSGQRISGIVDWVETSIGPAWLDVAHCCTNLAIRHGNAVADAFAAAYIVRTGRTPQPYFDVMDIVGFLPPPGRRSFFTDRAELARLEERLSAVLPAAWVG